MGGVDNGRRVRQLRAEPDPLGEDRGVRRPFVSAADAHGRLCPRRILAAVRARGGAHFELRHPYGRFRARHLYRRPDQEFSAVLCDIVEERHRALDATAPRARFHHPCRPGYRRPSGRMCPLRCVRAPGRAHARVTRLAPVLFLCSLPLCSYPPCSPQHDHDGGAHDRPLAPGDPRRTPHGGHNGRGDVDAIRRCRKPRRADRPGLLPCWGSEPTVGFEPTTFALQERCSTS